MFTQDELSIFYEKHFDRMYRFFYYKVLDKNMAEDLTSEVFLKFATAIAEAKSITEPDKYIMGIAKIVFTKFLEQKYQLPQVSIEAINMENLLADNTESYKEYNSIEDLLGSILEKVPSKQKQVLTLRFLQKMSTTETATYLGRDENYVRTTQKRGLQSVKAIIATEGLNLNTSTLILQDE